MFDLDLTVEKWFLSAGYDGVCAYTNVSIDDNLFVPVWQLQPEVAQTVQQRRLV